MNVIQAYNMLTIYLLLEPLSKILTGIITGLGRQGIASVFSLLSYWALGIPLTVIYVFDLNGGLRGIWLGATLSITLILIAMLGLLQTSDFESIAEQAH